MIVYLDAQQMNARGNGDTLARRIRAARAYAGVDQKAVANRLGVSAATVSAWERGANVPQISRPGLIEGLVDLSGLPRSFFETEETNR